MMMIVMVAATITNGIGSSENDPKVVYVNADQSTIRGWGKK